MYKKQKNKQRKKKKEQKTKNPTTNKQTKETKNEIRNKNKQKKHKKQNKTKPTTTARYPRGVTVKSMDCGIVESEFERQFRYYIHFRTKPLGNVWTPFYSQLWV